MYSNSYVLLKFDHLDFIFLIIGNFYSKRVLYVIIISLKMGFCMSDIRFRANKELLISRMCKIISTLTVILIVIGVYFTFYTLKSEEKGCLKYIEQNVKQTASNLRGRIKSDMQMLAVLAGNLSTETSSFSETDVTNFLLKKIEDEKFHRLSFTYPNGTNIRVQEKIGKLPSANMEGLSCFEIAMNGSPCFADVTEEPLARSGFVNRYYVPVYNSSRQIVGILGSMIDSDVFKTILSYNNFGNKGFSHIIDADGNYLVKSANETNVFPNFFDQKIKFIKTSEEKIRKDLKFRDNGTFQFKWKNGKIYVAAYSFIGYNNSFVLTDVPKDVLLRHINNILGAISVIVLTIGALLLLLLRYSEKLNRENETVIYKVAFTDEVTENINKTKFLLDAREMLTLYPDADYAMISMDITKFKVINELYGYNRANVILKDVFNIIKRNLTKGSVCARDFAATYAILFRYEQKEFIVKYFINTIVKEIEKYNNEVMSSISENVNLRVISKLSVIFGIYLISDKTLPIAQMCDRASLAKRNMKADVMNFYQFYDDGIRAQILQDKAIEDEMYQALNDKQFKMYLQPKFNMNTMELAGAEALVRWFHPKRGMLPPNDFIPLFERNGFIIELDKYMWRQACEFIAKRKISGENLFPVSVNVSRVHLNNDAFIEELLELIKEYDIDAKYLELELTESACLDDENRFIKIISKLKDYGFIINMDDFGTGYSSLNMLRHLPVDVLKLDRNFITDSIGDKKGETIVRYILKMANELNMQTVAEGIETPGQAQFLKECGCNIAQGYLYGRPLSVEQFINTFLMGEFSQYQN